MKMNIKQTIISMVIKKMEETQLLPWDCGFIANDIPPVNYTTGKPYSGCNNLLLMMFGQGTNEFITFKQAQAAGGKIRKGEHGLPITWYALYNKTQKRAAQQNDSKDDEIFPVLKHSTVFEISQCDGLEPHRQIADKVPNKTKSDIELWKKQFVQSTGLKLNHTLSYACYVPATHKINIRNIDEYKDSDTYYQTFFHEAAHSTGRALGRKQGNTFGNKDYSREEVIAELTSLFMCKHFGIEQSQVGNSAVYIKSWGEHLRKNPDWLIQGGRYAEQAYDYMIEKGL